LLYLSKFALKQNFQIEQFCMIVQLKCCEKFTCTNGSPINAIYRKPRSIEEFKAIGNSLGLIRLLLKNSMCALSKIQP